MEKRWRMKHYGKCTSGDISFRVSGALPSVYLANLRKGLWLTALERASSRSRDDRRQILKGFDALLLTHASHEAARFVQPTIDAKADCAIRRARVPRASLQMCPRPNPHALPPQVPAIGARKMATTSDRTPPTSKTPSSASAGYAPSLTCTSRAAYSTTPGTTGSRSRRACTPG